MSPREVAMSETLTATMSLNHALEEELFVIRNEESDLLKEARRTISRARDIAGRREPTDTEVQKFWAEFRRTHTGEDLTRDEFAWHNLFEFQREGLRACAKFFRG